MKVGRFDLREFQRVLFNSQTYQRAANTSPDLEKGPYLFPGPLMRRLVESGVRFVEVSGGGWDMHKKTFGGSWQDILQQAAQDGVAFPLSDDVLKYIKGFM